MGHKVCSEKLVGSMHIDIVFLRAVVQAKYMVDLNTPGLTGVIYRWVYINQVELDRGENK
jgi:hypothetical protein